MLLDALQAPSTPDWMKMLPAITTLRTMWEQQAGAKRARWGWRREPVLPAAQLITSPYDLDARTGREKSNILDRVQGPFHESPVMKRLHT
jgi:transposase